MRVVAYSRHGELLVGFGDAEAKFIPYLRWQSCEAHRYTHGGDVDASMHEVAAVIQSCHVMRMKTDVSFD